MRTFPVAEIFGPTIQGEGVDQGSPCSFVRFGGCDYKCDWCDTPYAVVPSEVRELKRYTVDEITGALSLLKPKPSWVILSGGNPAIYDLHTLVKHLHGEGYRVAVETQGSRWQDWLLYCDRVCFSPKPPSSGMFKGFKSDQWAKVDKVLTQYTRDIWKNLLVGEEPRDQAFLKVVIFDEEDYLFAQALHETYPEYDLYLSAGNDAGRTVGNPTRIDTRTKEQVQIELLERSKTLVDRVLADNLLAGSDRVKVQSQYHVLVWGNEMGV